ncbi:MAG: TonB-dependent receptor, partial [Bryobacteraceae bacterium]|nr:TonB-dependent receptor [Bryobacteraceae bacterium]
KRNQFGGVLSGPVVKDRLFVLGSGEWLVDRLVGISAPRATFTEAERQTAAPSVRPFLSLYPAANVPNTNLFDLGGIFSRTTFRSFFVRGDYVVTKNHLLSARWNATDTESSDTGRIFGQGQAIDSTNSSTVLSLNSTITPTLVNEARAYYTNRFSNTVPFTPLLGDQTVNDTVGLLNVAGAERLGGIFRNYLMTHNYQFSDDISVQRGRHGLKFGGIVRKVQVNSTANDNTDGTLTFDSRQAFLAGIPRTYTRVIGDTRLDQRTTEAGIYAQTDYRLRSNLNINLGLRWELYTPGIDNRDRVPVNYKTDYNNFAPRIGFSWSPGSSSGLVVRGGYGIFTTPLPLRYLGNLRFQPSRIASFTSINPVFPNLLSGTVTQSSEQTQTSPDLVQPYSQQYNFSMDYRLPTTQTVVSVAYVGTRGIFLPLTLFPNGGDRLPQAQRPDPTLGLVRLLSTTGASNYHSLQATAQGRFAQRFNVRLAYTWSRAIDDLSTDSQTLISESNRRLDRGLADFHLAHSLSSALFYAIPGRNGAFGLMKDWTISGVMQARSGRVFSLLSGTDNLDGNRNNRINAIDGTLSRVNQGPFAVVPANSMTLAQLRQGVTPVAGRIGTLGRNTEVGDPFFDLSLSLQKEVTFTERLRGQLRIEAFNATNTSNFDAYVGSLADPRFGQATTASQPRAIQLAFRVTF